MSKIYANDAVYIAEAVRNHLNTWERKPADFELDKITKDPPAMMIQPLSGTERLRSYVNGSYIAAWKFAVYIRIPGTDTAERLDATGCLTELAAWLSELTPKGQYANLPIIDEDRNVSKIQLESTPSIAARYEDGTEDYQAIFTLEYKYLRRF